MICRSQRKVGRWHKGFSWIRAIARGNCRKDLVGFKDCDFQRLVSRGHAEGLQNTTMTFCSRWSTWLWGWHEPSALWGEFPIPIPSLHTIRRCSHPDKSNKETTCTEVNKEINKETFIKDCDPCLGWLCWGKTQSRRPQRSLPASATLWILTLALACIKWSSKKGRNLSSCFLLQVEIQTFPKKFLQVTWILLRLSIFKLCKKSFKKLSQPKTCWARRSSKTGTLFSH